MDTRQASFLLGQSISGNANAGTGILAGAKIGLSLARDIGSGMGLGKREQFMEDERLEKERRATEEQKGIRGFKVGGNISYGDILKYRSEGIKLMKKGGDIDFGQRMTGEFIEGLPENQEHQAVVEVEAGEHLLQPDGSMQEVLGNKHSQGGEKLSEEDVQEGTIVISDDTKVGGEKSKYFRDKYDIKLTAKNTYADVVKRVEDKIGVTKITKDLEDLYKKLEKEEKNTEHLPTKDLNREYISEMINEKEQEKADLETQRLELMEDVYSQQEGEKGLDAEESDIDFEFLKQIAQENGLDELQATEAVQEFKKGGSYFKIPKMEGGGEIENLKRLKELKKKHPKQFEKLYEVTLDDEGEITSAVRKEGVTLEQAEVTDYIRKDFEDLPEYSLYPDTGGEQGLDEVVVRNTPNSVNSLTPNPYQANPTTGTPLQRYVKPEKEEKLKTDKEKKKQMLLPQLPDDWVLPPSSMQPPRKNVTNLGRDEAMYVSPDQGLTQNQSQVNAAMGSLATLPPAQRAAMIASLQEGAMGADAQTIAQTNQFNLQSDTDVRRFNIGQADKESVAAGLNADQYEDKMFKTQAIYDENVRGFLDYLRDSNTTKFKDIRNQNLVGSMFEDYYINNNGEVVIRPDSKGVYSINGQTIGSGAQPSTTKKKK